MTNTVHTQEYLLQAEQTTEHTMTNTVHTHESFLKFETSTDAPTFPLQPFFVTVPASTQ